MSADMRVNMQQANRLLALGQADQAITAYDRVLATSPEIGEAWHNRGIALAQKRRFSLAVQSFGRAIDLHPESAASWHNRGMALSELGEYAQAAHDHARALELQPEMPDLRGNLVLARLNCSDWEGVEEQRDLIARALTGGKPAIVPFGNLFISDSPAGQLICARLWMARHAPPQPPLWRGERYHHRRIRVAWVSGDFRAHPVAGLILPVLQNADRTKFEYFGVSFGPDDNSDLRRRISATLEHFLDVRGRNDDEIADLLRQNEIDIAVDLMGITSGCRPGIFAARPAPIQVSWLGFPATTGAEFIDYAIADKWAVTDSAGAFFSERLAFLPRCYLPGEFDRLPVSPAPRREAGLPDDAFVFCSFNANYKILPETFACWMSILRETKNGVLWLSEPNEIAKANLRREAAGRGIAPDRLIFAAHVPSFAGHLRRVAAADLFLDTLPFNAHSTAIDAVAAGVPVLTQAGTAMAGRAGTSLVSALNLPELIAGSRQEYERTAIRLAHDPGELRVLRERLCANRAAVFDAAAFARDLEQVLQHMHGRQTSGLPPQTFSVSGLPG